MARSRYLPNAPITEALIDFRVKLPLGFQVENFKARVEALRSQFPLVEEQRALRTVLDISQKGSSETTDIGLQGYIARSEDRKNVVQFRADGFTYNRLRPYTRWEEVFPRAMELWNIYVEASSAELVTRLAVRYINHLRLPKPSLDFDDYLTSGPHIPSELPQTIGTFLTRVQILDSNSALAANVIQALEPPMDPRSTTVILDIDAFRVKELEPTDPSIQETLQLLRVFKNKIFFSHITEDTARLFE